MSFWMPFMETIKREEEIYDKMRNENKSREEIEIEELQERQITIFQKLGMIGAETIREYKDNQQRIINLQKEIAYTQWFNKNKVAIQRFFELMKKSFIYDNEEVIYPRSVDNDNIEFGDCILNREYLKRTLKRYGYTVKDDTVHDNNPSGLIIKYRKEN